MQDKDIKDIFKISPSAVNSFISCPRKYHFRYTADIPEINKYEKSSLMWLLADEKGILIHRVMELYVNEAIIPYSEKLTTSEKEQAVSALDLIEYDEYLFEKIWQQAVTEIEKTIQNKYTDKVVIPKTAKEKEAKEYKRQCTDAIKNMLKKMKERKQYPVRTELSFGMNDIAKDNADDGNYMVQEAVIHKDGEDDFAIKGSIDRVDYDITTGKYIIIDYKTGKLKNIKKLCTPGKDDLIQDRMYTLAFETMNPEKEISGSRFVFLEENNDELCRDMDTDSKNKFNDKLWDLIKDIRAKEDKACKDNTDIYQDYENTCKYCSYEALCKAYDELSE